MQLYDRINTRAISHSKLPHADAVKKAQDLLEELRRLPQQNKYVRDVQHILDSAHIRVSILKFL